MELTPQVRRKKRDRKGPLFLFLIAYYSKVMNKYLVGGIQFLVFFFLLYQVAFGTFANIIWSYFYSLNISGVLFIGVILAGDYLAVYFLGKALRGTEPEDSTPLSWVKVGTVALLFLVLPFAFLLIINSGLYFPH